MSEEGTRARSVGALLAGVAGGLLLAGSTAGTWFATEREHDVGGVPVTEEATVAGGEVAVALLPLGLAAVLVAWSVMVLPSKARQVAGVVLVAVAVAAAVVAVRALMDPPAPIQPGGVGAAAGGVIAVAVAGAALLRPVARTRTLPARYDLDVDDADEEWQVASADEGEEER